MKDLAQSCLAFLGHPSWAVEGPRFVFQNDERYHRVFPEKVQPSQLLLGYRLFEQASAVINADTSGLPGISYLRYPLVATTAAVVRDWLGVKEPRYLTAQDSAVLYATIEDWAGEVMKLALRELVSTAKSNELGVRSLVRRSDWIEEPIASVLEDLRDRLTMEREIAQQMKADPQLAGLRAKFPLSIKD